MADLTTGDAHALCVREGQHICHQPSGRTCVERGCMNAAGTYWGPYWCPEHDKERLDRVSASLEAIVAGFPSSNPVASESDR